jgi:hypothetical protein
LAHTGSEYKQYRTPALEIFVINQKADTIQPSRTCVEELSSRFGQFKTKDQFQMHEAREHEWIKDVSVEERKVS